jgi:hypothetical protein
LSFSRNSPYGRCVITRGYDHNITLWDADSGEIIVGNFCNSSDWGAICFSPNGDKVYYSCRSNDRFLVMELNLTQPSAEPKEFHRHHATGSSMMIRTYGHLILTAARDGFVQVCDVHGNPLRRLEVPRTNIADFEGFRELKMVEDAISFIQTPYGLTLLISRNIKTFAFPSQFLPIISSPIKGKFEKLLSERKIVNPFPFIGMNRETLANLVYSDLFGTTLIDNIAPPDRIRLFARAIISCKIAKQPYIHSEEYDLLESLLVYLYYEASVEEQNIPMLIELLSGEQSEEILITRLFTRLYANLADNSPSPNRRALARFNNYRRIREEEKKKAIVDSLLGRLLPFFRIYSESLPIVPVDAIHSLAISMVMNFGTNWNFPGVFDDIAEAQVLYLELLWHYLNTLSGENRTRKKLASLLGDENEYRTQILDNFSNIQENTQMKALSINLEEFLARIDHSKLIVANRRIVNFYREI